MELDPEMIERIKARARFDRQIVDEYNANLLLEQGIEPTPELLQEMCTRNIPQALAAYRRTYPAD